MSTRPAPAADEESVLLEHLPFTTDAGVGARARIGLVVLATDYTVEHEFRQVFTMPGVDTFVARIENEDNVTPQTLSAMAQRITNTLRLILPGQSLDVVAYACTSASVVIGEDEVFARLRAAQPEAKLTTPITAAFAALRALKAERIAVLTPYRRDVNEVLRRYIVSAGFQVPVFGSFNEERDSVVSRIDASSLENAVDRLVQGREIDAVFVSCTSVRLMRAAAALEQRLGIPVTSSNHALAWHCLRLAGVNEPAPELGRLFEL